MSAAKAWATEADLCAAFIDAIRSPRKASWEKKAPEPLWRVYPETAGFDILLVRISDGVQVGIEAKLSLNAKVLEQALPNYRWSQAKTGPDYRAVLVPANKTGSLCNVCAHLGVTVIAFTSRPEEDYVSGPAFAPNLPKDGEYWHIDQWHEWMPDQRCPLPDYVPDVAAGMSAPIALTEWKVKAIKLAVLLEERPVRRADFAALKLSPSRWTDAGTKWLQRTPDGYVPGPKMPDFRAQHPRNYDEIAADKASWVPAPPTGSTSYGTLLDAFPVSPAPADGGGAQ
jgi:hypothetical protein